MRPPLSLVVSTSSAHDAERFEATMRFAAAITYSHAIFLPDGGAEKLREMLRA